MTPALNLEHIDDQISRLSDTRESLMDMSSNLLREAISEGVGATPPSDKKINQAIRAIDKAVNCLETARELYQSPTH